MDVWYAIQDLTVIIGNPRKYKPLSWDETQDKHKAEACPGENMGKMVCFFFWV